MRSVCLEWEKCEAELLAGRVALPLLHRCVWIRMVGGSESWFLAVRDNSGTCRGGFAIQVERSRALPKHVLLRVRRCGPMGMEGAIEVAFAALAELARLNSWVLRVNIELFSPDSDFRTMAGRSLSALGFRPASEPRSYENTISVDLSPTEDEIFARLSKSARRNIRAIGKDESVEVRPIRDAELGPRMEAMRKATFTRTGGSFTSRDWGAVMNFCHEHPAQARLVGLFRTNTCGPDSLLAYALSFHHIDHAEYNDSAAIRDDQIKVPLAYALIWDLIIWAKNCGAAWFDMGGVTPGQLNDTSDPLGGISDFKRFFSKTLVPVGEEWEWEPHPARARLARFVRAVASWFTRHRT